MEPVNSQNPNPDDVVDTELEEGDVPTSSSLARDEGTEQVGLGTGGERKRDCELSGFNPSVSQLVRV
ncbi:hypothetical protein AOLI_G00160520 [Acnodon oligacanthus]